MTNPRLASTKMGSDEGRGMASMTTKVEGPKRVVSPCPSVRWKKTTQPTHKCVNAVVPEARVTLDPRLLGQNVIVLTFEVAEDFSEAGVIVDQVAEAGRVDDGERDADTVLLKLLNAMSARARLRHASDRTTDRRCRA